MRALTFWKLVVQDRSNFLDQIIALLAEHGIRYCVIGGAAVNAFVDPVITLDLDLAVAVDQIPLVEDLTRRSFKVERFEHSLNISLQGSRLRVQIQLDPRYASFVERATVRDVLDLNLPVASIEDLLQGKIWAAMDPSRRPTKRQKDRLDIARLLEAYPHVQGQIPAALLEQLR